jgi:endoglycosylceramidase
MVLAVALLAGACSGSDSDSSGATSTTGSTGGDEVAADETAGLRPLHATRGGDQPGVYDDQGRQVLLRGVNLNVLGDYAQNSPDYPVIIPATDEDWAAMASYGFDSVRLLMSWSLLEPTRGDIDQDYLDQIQAAIDAAAANDIYVILDLHQDAWSKFSATPEGVVCPDGTKPSIGWDGAPEWATITDGADTCAPAGVRELAPAVAQAFENFYLDTDGIQTALVETWGRVAEEFADEPAVAGYDLFNEPNWGASTATSGARLGEFTNRAIAAIRDGESRSADGFEHIVFFEPVVIFPGEGTLIPPDTITDTNIVFAPHGYNESIQGGTVEEGFAASAEAAASYGTTFWIGEYGWFGDPAEQAPIVARYAAEEDRYLVGGAWWQWKQACGDPHSVRARDGVPSEELVHLHRTQCPGDVDLGPVAEWMPILSRAYPRAAPGQLDELVSDPATGEFTVSGATDDEEAPLELWVPDRGDGEPVLSGTGLGDVQVRALDGGFRVTAQVSGDYVVTNVAG